MKPILLLALLLFILSIPSAHAITIQQGVSFNTTGTNTTYIAGANFTVDTITVTSTLLNITNSSTGDFIMSATPSSGSLNITIWGFNASYKRFNISSNTSGITASFVIGNITPVSALMVFLKNGAYWNTFTSNASGYINFTYNEGYSNVQFEALQDTTAPTVSLSLSSSSIYQTQSITITCSASDNYQLSSTSLTISKPSGSTAASCNQAFADTSMTGTYTVTYSATDTSGNTASTSQSFGVNQLGGSSSSSGGGSSSGGSSATTRSITAMPNDVLTKITVSLKADAASPSITVAKLTSVPIAIDNAYQYFSITKNNFNNSQIENATIEFNVNKSWILANNITSVYLARYDNNWTRLRTELINSTNAYNSYKAYADSFSYFAIAGEKAQAAAGTESGNITQINQTTANITKPSEPPQALQPGIATAVISGILLVVIGFKFRSIRHKSAKLLKMQKERFRRVKDSLTKKERERVSQLLNQGCARVAKAEMDDAEEKNRD